MKVFLEISIQDLNIDISKYGGLVESVYINVCTYRLMFLVSSDIALYTHCTGQSPVTSQRLVKAGSADDGEWLWWGAGAKGVHNILL